MRCSIILDSLCNSYCKYLSNFLGGVFVNIHEIASDSDKQFKLSIHKFLAEFASTLHAIYGFSYLSMYENCESISDQFNL